MDDVDDVDDMDNHDWWLSMSSTSSIAVRASTAPFLRLITRLWYLRFIPLGKLGLFCA